MKCNHTKIPNAVLEQLMRQNLSPYESRVLKAIWRKTWGWHKEEDAISVSQIQNMTDLKRRHVSRALERLKQKNLVQKEGRQLVKGKWIDVWKPCVVFTDNAQEESSITSTGDAKDDLSEMGDIPASPLQDPASPLQVTLFVTSTGAHKRNSLKKLYKRKKEILPSFKGKGKKKKITVKEFEEKILSAFGGDLTRAVGYAAGRYEIVQEEEPHSKEGGNDGKGKTHSNL